MPERPSIMSLPRQVAAAVLSRLPLDGRGKVRLPTVWDLAQRRRAHVAACEAHLALYPQFPCVVCHRGEAVSDFIVRASRVGELPLAVPLCFSCREPMVEMHPSDRLDAFKLHGVDALNLARELRRRSGDLRLMAERLGTHTRQAILQREALRVTLR